MNRPDRAPGVRLVTDHPGSGPKPSVESPALVTDLDATALLASVRPERILVIGVRFTGGLGVQAIWSPSDNTTWITVVLNDETETFEVPNDKLLDAFNHPYAYGATLKF